MEEKARENRVRRMAERQGLSLRRSRRRDPYATGFGNYWLVDEQDIQIIGDRSGVSLDEIEEYLMDLERPR